jgi:MOSC domain-containing protein YiiM
MRKFYQQELIMLKGSVTSIYISPKASQLMISVESIEAVSGKGLKGDRYFQSAGSFSRAGDATQEVTLIEAETIDTLIRDHEIPISPGGCRRNIITRDIRLNDLIGVQFRVGETVLKGLKLCEPCSHLAKLTSEKILPALVHRGGLRAQILTGGIIKVGDDITEHEDN